MAQSRGNLSSMCSASMLMKYIVFADDTNFFLLRRQDVTSL